MDTGEYVGNIHYLFPLIVYLIKLLFLDITCPLVLKNMLTTFMLIS